MRDNEREAGAAVFRLTFWQAAGLGVAGDQAWALLDSAGAIVASGEAWDPDGLTAPTAARPATGTYTLSYDPTYADEDGTSTPLTLYAAHPTPQSSSDLHATATVSGNTVTIYVRNAAGALTNAAVFVSVK